MPVFRWKLTSVPVQNSSICSHHQTLNPVASSSCKHTAYILSLMFSSGKRSSRVKRIFRNGDLSFTSLTLTFKVNEGEEKDLESLKSLLPHGVDKAISPSVYQQIKKTKKNKLIYELRLRSVIGSTGTKATLEGNWGVSQSQIKYSSLCVWF